MKIFKGKETSTREREEKVTATAELIGDTDAWYLFKFFDTNTRRWSPVYAAFSLTAAHDEMRDLVNKQPKRAFLMKGMGNMVGSQFNADPQYKVYIGVEYEDLG